MFIFRFFACQFSSALGYALLVGVVMSRRAFLVFQNLCGCALRAAVGSTPIHLLSLLVMTDVSTVPKVFDLKKTCLNCEKPSGTFLRKIS